MRKFCVLIVLLLASTLPVLSQRYIALLNVDSLKKVLLVAKDTQRINTLNLLSRRILFGERIPNYKEIAASYHQEALTLSKALNYKKGWGNALLSAGIISIEKRDNFQKTLPSLQMALSFLQQGGDAFSVAGCLENIGYCYHMLGQNASAILFYDSAEHDFQQLGDTISSVWVMIEKGHSYFDLGNYLIAYKTFHQAQETAPKNDTMLQAYALCQMTKLFLGANLPETTIEYARKIRDFYPPPSQLQEPNLPWPLMWGLQVSGDAYLQLNKVDSALYFARLLNVPLEQQDADDNLFYGRLYLAMHQPAKALVYFANGYRLSKDAFHKISIARNAVELARTHVALGNFPKAIYYGKDALEISRRINVLLEQKNAAGILAEIYQRTGEYKKADQYHQLYKSLNESWAPEEQRRRLSLIQVQSELELQKKQAQLLAREKRVNQQQIIVQQAQIEKRSFLLYLFVAALLTVLVIAALVVRNARLRRKKEQLQQLMVQSEARLEETRKEQLLMALQKEKADLEMQVLRSQMNPHFIFNCLSSINRFILINKTEEAADYLTKFSRLMRMALHNSEKSFITLETELEALRLYLELERLRFKNAFDYSITMVNTIETSAIFIPPLLFQPFAENAIWHGLMHKKGFGHLDISLSIEGKLLQCFITDNGIGRQEAALIKSKSAENNKSMGMQKTMARLALLNEQSGENTFFAVEDVVDEHDRVTGTKVIFKIQYLGLVEASQLTA